LISVIKESC